MTAEEADKPLVSRDFVGPAGGNVFSMTNTVNRRTALRYGLTTAAAAVATLTQAPPAAPASADPGFDKQLLDRANFLRARHGCPPLALDAEIGRWAQEWATTMASNGRLEHRPTNKYGENLYLAWSSTGATPSGAAVADAWYDQIKEYTYFGREPDMSTFRQWGLFTQLVWKSSRRIGVGLAKTTSGHTYVAVDFDPAGNVARGFAANVPAPG